MYFKTLLIIVATFINLNITCVCYQKIQDNAENKHNPDNRNAMYSTPIDEKTDFFTDLNYIYRIKRVAPRNPRTECNFSKDMLLGLKSEIKAAMKNITMNINTASCTLNFDVPDDCDSLLSLLQCGINYILERFNFTKQHSIPQSEYDALKNAYHKLNEMANTFKDNAGRNMKKLLKKIEHLIILNTQQTISLCASEIDSGRVKSAVEEYNKLDDPEFENFQNIIEKSFMYRYTKFNIVLIYDKMIKFIEQVPLSHRLVGIEKLLQIMKSAESDTRYLRSKFKDFTDLKTIKDTVLENWAKLMESVRLHQMIEYSEITPETYNNLLHKIIADIFFHRMDNKKILKFIEDLPNLTHKIIGYEIVHKIIIWIN